MFRCSSQRSDQDLENEYERNLAASLQASLNEKKEKERQEEEERQKKIRKQEDDRAASASMGRKRQLAETKHELEGAKKKIKKKNKEQLRLLLQANV